MVRRMTVSPIGPVGSGVSPVYAALSPYLNGVVRTSDAAAAAAQQAAAAASSAVAAAAATAARAQATATVTAAPPFLNPAITAIAGRSVLGPAPAPSAQPASAPPSPTDSVAYGDSGLLVQSYGAVALLTGPLAAAAVYGLPRAPAIPPVAPVAAYPRTARIDATA